MITIRSVIDLHVMEDGSIELSTTPGHEKLWPLVVRVGQRLMGRKGRR